MTDVWLPATYRRETPRADHGPRTSRTVGVVLHTIEGNALSALAWFDNPAAGGVGAQLIVGPKSSFQLMPLDHKAWHAVAANADRVGIEQQGYAEWDHDEWHKQENLDTVTRAANRTGWICRHYALGEPKREHNYWQHKDGGQAWGGHFDVGPHYPWGHFHKTAVHSYHHGWPHGGHR